MRILGSPIRYMRKQRARRKQILTALQMLSVSGVVRPGHIEPRYFVPPSHVDALNRQERKRHAAAAAMSGPSPTAEGARVDWTKLRQLVGTFRFSGLQIEQ